MHRQTKTLTARPSFLWTMPRSSLLELRNAQLKMVEKRRNGWRHPATNHSLRMFSTMCGQGLNRFKIKLLSKNSHSSKDKARGRMPTNRQRNKLIQVREHKGLPNNNRQIGLCLWAGLGSLSLGPCFSGALPDTAGQVCPCTTFEQS